MVLTWLVGVAISAFGDAVWIVALAWTAAHTLSPALAGAVIGIEMFPQAVLVLVGGVIADRWDPRRVLIAGQVARAVVLVLGALAWRAGYDGAPTLFAIALAFGIAAGLTLPSGMALIRQIVSPDDFGTVMGWNQVSGRVMRLLGAPAAGSWWPGAGPWPRCRSTPRRSPSSPSCSDWSSGSLPAAPPEHARWPDSFTDGLGYLRRSPTARVFVIGLTALNVFVSPVVALGLALRVEGSGWGPEWLGISDAALAAGAIVGSLAAIRWQPAYAAGYGFRVLVLQGVGLAVVGVPFIPVVVVGMLTVGVTAGMASVWLSGAFLKAARAAYTGRVSSVTSLGDMTLMPLSMPVLGALFRRDERPHLATAVFGLSMSVLCLSFAHPAHHRDP